MRERVHSAATAVEVVDAASATVTACTTAGTELIAVEVGEATTTLLSRRTLS